MAGLDSRDEPVALQGIRIVPNELRVPVPDASAVWCALLIEMARGPNRPEGNDFTLGDFGHSWRV